MTTLPAKKPDQEIVKRQRGGQPFVPTDVERKQVEAMAGYGLYQDQIAVLIRDGISKDTLYKYFQHELARGKAKANAKIGQTLYQKAVDGDTTALIWWTKTQMKWRETTQHEHSGIDGQPVEFRKIERVIVDVTKSKNADITDVTD